MSSDDDRITPVLTAPGTELLYDIDSSAQLSELQHVKHGDGHILLVPQPSLTDPNDPLRWPLLTKWATLLNGIWYSFNGAVTGPIMAAGMVPLTVQFGKSLQELTYANGATLVCQGVFTTVWMPFAVKYGRRPIYLTSNLLMGIACIWLGIASNKTYTPFIIGRAALGAFEAPIESIVPSAIADTFFLHERGAKLSLYGMAVLGGNEIGPMLSAFIDQNLGMDWAFYVVATWIAGSLVCMFFAMPETKYTGQRPVVHINSVLAADSGEKADARHIDYIESKIPRAQQDADEATNKRSYISNLKFWSAGDPNISLRKAFFAPFVLVAYPTVLWSCVTYGFALGWNVILGATIAQNFAPPPYNFDSSSQGLVFLSPFVGSIIGTYLCGPFTDSVANYFTKRNNGIREPEMRLPTVIIACALTFLGALVSGLTYHYQTHWAGPIVGFGILSAGGQMGATLAMSYSIDCHKELSVELMVTVSSLKSLIAWIWTWCINDWIVADGFLTVIMVIATLNVVVYLTTLPLYLKGRSIRFWLARVDMLGKAGLRQDLSQWFRSIS